MPPSSVCHRGVVLAALLLSTACGGTQHPKDDPYPPPGDPTSKVDPKDLYQAGLEFAQAGDMIRASQYITAAMKNGFPAKVAVPSLVQVYVKSSRYRDAIAVAEKQVTDDPSDWRLRLVLATMYLAVREVDHALEHAKAASVTAPNDPHPHYLLAVIGRDEFHDDALARAEFTAYLAAAPKGDHAAEAQSYLNQPPPKLISIQDAPVQEPDSQAAAPSTASATTNATVEAP